MSVTNDGPGGASRPIMVVDTVPPDFTLVGSSGDGWSCSASEQTVSCTHAGPLAAGATSLVTLEVRADASAPPTSTDRATVSDASDRPVALAEAPLVVQAGPGGGSGTPELAITIDPPGLFTAGGPGSIHVTVTSVGTADVLGPETVIDVLPAGFTFTGWTGDEWSCSAAGQTVTCSRAGPLAIGASRDFWIDVAVAESAATGNNLASVSPPPGGLGVRCVELTY
ncbi:MAG: DUF11 domain-containing protein [Chloroflexi bacterium]|nr:DUF11 domain-containing protein [Chloroflexota bacterium]